MFFLMQNTFIVPAMQHGCRAKPLLRRLDKSQSNYVISDERAREEGRNNYFVGTEINAAWAPGRCIMDREKAV